MPLYDEFGCRVHELIKANKGRNTKYKIEVFITEVLKSIRRVEKVNWVIVTDNPNKQLYTYQVNFSVSCVIDNQYNKENIDSTIVEGEFLV